MEIKKNDKIVITGRHICFVAGVLSSLCAIYWIVIALSDGHTNLPALLGSVSTSLLLILYATKKPK